MGWVASWHSLVGGEPGRFLATRRTGARHAGLCGDGRAPDARGISLFRRRRRDAKNSGSTARMDAHVGIAGGVRRVLRRPRGQRIRRRRSLRQGRCESRARSESDRKRDALDHPAELLRLAGIKPGMRVADVLAGGGYYSEILSYVVGPTGHVLMLNNAAFDGWSPSWPKRVAGNRLPNVEHQTVDLNRMNLAPGSLDAVLLIKVYHDLYWVDPEGRLAESRCAQHVGSAVQGFEGRRHAAAGGSFSEGWNWQRRCVQAAPDRRVVCEEGLRVAWLTLVSQSRCAAKCELTSGTLLHLRRPRAEPHGSVRDGVSEEADEEQPSIAVRLRK